MTEQAGNPAASGSHPVRLRPAEVREFRRVTLDTGKTANLFAPGEPVTLKLSADDLSGARLDRPELRGTVRRYDRTVAAEFRLKLPQPAGTRRSR